MRITEKPHNKNMLQHERPKGVVLNPKAPKSIRLIQKANDKLKARIIEMKLAKRYSADIVAETGASESIIQSTWREYRDAHPEAEKVPTGNYKMVDKNRYVKKPGELI